MKNKKVVFFDIDGTIFDRKLGVIDSTKKAILQLEKNGHIPFICTGRPKIMVGNLFDNMGFQGMIAGCGTYMEYEEKVLLKEYMSSEVVAACVERLEKDDIFLLLEGPTRVYSNYSTGPLISVMERLSKLAGSNMASYDRHDLPKIQKITCHYKDDTSVFKQLEMDLKVQVIYHENAKAVEIITSDYNKGTAITDFLNRYEIPLENSYAFGDSNNDIDMMKAVDNSIAMGNSCEELFLYTKYRTKSLKDDGIFYGLQELGLI